MTGWLRGRIYGQERLPRRWTWLLVFASTCMLTSWMGGRPF